MTREEENELILKAQAGDQDAATDLFNRHQGMIHKVARFCIRRGADESDAYSFAFLTFTKAMRAYDPEQSVKFITYLTKALQRNVCRADRGGAIRVPYNGRADAPTLISMSATSGNGRGTFGDIIADHRVIDPLAPQAEVEEMRQRFHILITRLSEQQRIVIIGTCIGLMNRDLAVGMNVSRQRIHQVLQAAIERLQKLHRERGKIRPIGNPDLIINEILEELSTFPRTTRTLVRKKKQALATA